MKQRNPFNWKGVGAPAASKVEKASAPAKKLKKSKKVKVDAESETPSEKGD